MTAMGTRCIGWVQEQRPARGMLVKLYGSTAALPVRGVVSGHLHAIHHACVSKSVPERCDQHLNALHLHKRCVRRQAQPQDDAPSVDDLLSQLDDLAIPDIDQDLRTFQEQAGALFLVRNNITTTTTLS